MIQPVDEFFDEDIAIPAVYTPGDGGEPRDVMIIIDQERVPVEMGGGGYDNYRLIGLVEESDVPGIDKRATITINSTTYHVAIPADSEMFGVRKIELTLDPF